MDREVETASLLIAGRADTQRRKSVRSALEAVCGVARGEVHPQKPQATVVFDPTRVVPRQLRLVVRAPGCSAEGIRLPNMPASGLRAGSPRPCPRMVSCIPRGRHATTTIRQPISAERQPGL